MPDPVDALILDLLEWIGPAPRPELARVAALLKFGAIGLSLAYGLSGTVAAAIGRAREAPA